MPASGIPYLNEELLHGDPLNINGTRSRMSTAIRTPPLLWVIRETSVSRHQVRMRDPQCGACTVHVDGRHCARARCQSRRLPIAQVTTIEGLSTRAAKAVQKAWSISTSCSAGHCQSRQTCRATALLEKKPKPSDTVYRSHANGSKHLSCATYQRIRAAITPRRRSSPVKGGAPCIP